MRKVKSLVKLMALAPHHRLHREHVIDRLWPDKGSEDGANNLHQALYMARRILEPDLPPRRASSYLQLRQDMLLLEAPGGLWIDVEALLAAAREAHERRIAQTYRQALRLYRWLLDDLETAFSGAYLAAARRFAELGRIDLAVFALRVLGVEC